MSRMSLQSNIMVVTIRKTCSVSNIVEHTIVHVHTADYAQEHFVHRTLLLNLGCHQLRAECEESRPVDAIDCRVNRLLRWFMLTEHRNSLQRGSNRTLASVGASVTGEMRNHRLTTISEGQYSARSELFRTRRTPKKHDSLPNGFMISVVLVKHGHCCVVV